MDRAQWEAVRALQAKDAALVKRISETLPELARLVESLAQLDQQAGEALQRRIAAEMDASLERTLRLLVTSLKEVFQRKEDNLEDFDSSINTWALQTLQRDAERLLDGLAAGRAQEP